MIEQKGILIFMHDIHFMNRLLMPGMGSYGIGVDDDDIAWITFFGDQPWVDNCMDIEIL